MNSVYNCVDSVAKNANRFNLDDLLKVMVEWNDPEEVRKDLQILYFHAANAVFNASECVGTELANAFATLQEIIEALSTANDLKAAKLAVTIK